MMNDECGMMNDRLVISNSSFIVLHSSFRFSVSRTGSACARPSGRDRKSTRLNSSHVRISYADFCLKKKNALRDYFRANGRMVLAAEGRKPNASHPACAQHFSVPDSGTVNGRRHFQSVHVMRTLPTGSVDPNFGRRVRNRRQLNSLQNTWPYGYSMPIAVRYTQDAFSLFCWLRPLHPKCTLFPYTTLFR